jgi:predicted RNase H-like HicB family nuclease
MTEILFIVEEEDGGYHAKAVGASIVAHAETREELANNVREAMTDYFGRPQDAPKVALLHYVHDETIALNDAAAGQPARLSQREEVWQKLRGAILRDDDPYGPAVPPEDWEATR